MSPKKVNTAEHAARYSAALSDIKQKREEARQLLLQLKREKKNAERKHKRVIKSAMKLDTQDLCELAGIKNLTVEELASYLSKIEADRAAARAAAPPRLPRGLPQVLAVLRPQTCPLHLVNQSLHRVMRCLLMTSRPA